MALPMALLMSWPRDGIRAVWRTAALYSTGYSSTGYTEQSRLELGVLEQLSGRHSKSSGNRHDGVHGHVELAALNRAVVAAVNVGFERKGFLRVALLLAYRADGLAERLVGLGLLGWHGAIVFH